MIQILLMKTKLTSSIKMKGLFIMKLKFKPIALALVATMSICAFTGCGSDSTPKETATTSNSHSEAPKEDQNLFANLKSSWIGQALYQSEALKLIDAPEQHKKVAELLENLNPESGVEFEIREGNELVAKPTNGKKEGLIYIGELTPNKRPTGWGIIYNLYYKEPVLVGEFKDGHLSGYTVSILNMADFYANIEETLSAADLKAMSGAVYKLESGKPTAISIGAFPQFNRLGLLDFSGSFDTKPINGKYVTYIGDTKILDVSIPDNKFVLYDNAGKELFKAESITPVTDSRTGEIIGYNLKGIGHEYYSNGNLKYEGDATAHVGASSLTTNYFTKQGQGTSYKEDGSVEYKGEWVNNKYK